MAFCAAHFVLLALVALSAPVSVLGDAPPVQRISSFKSFFAGEWKVHKGAVDSATGGAAELDLSAVQHFSTRQSNSSHALIGHSFENDTATGQKSDELYVQVDFEEGSDNRGVFRTGTDSDDLATLFEFDFVPHPNGMLISYGKWNGKQPSRYQFVAAAPDRFIVTVTAGAGAGATTSVMSGARVIVSEPPTFFQKYGTMIMLMGFFIVNRWVQSKVKAPAEGADPAAGAAAGGAAPVVQESGRGAAAAVAGAAGKKNQ